LRVPFSYLQRQFTDTSVYFEKIERFLQRCDFTLGEDLEVFEKRYADFCSVKHAIGVGSGTDALALSMRAAGVGSGDEVITAPNSFIATTGAIVQIGARPIYVDVGADLNLDPARVEDAITARTRAILPVHWAGAAADMPSLVDIAKQKQLVLVEDGCQALGAEVAGKKVGGFGIAAGFSVHPLKPLHVWGDGGVIVTDSDEMAAKLRLIRNHGLKDRDTVEIYGVNSRFDTLQAVVGNVVMDSLEGTITARIAHAHRLDEALRQLEGNITLPKRETSRRHVFHLYQVFASRRDELLGFLQGRGIEAKVHYPIPLHLQPAAKAWGYREGQFPVAESQSRETITLPCHQYLESTQLDFMIDTIREFYGQGTKA
jgi:dTDP-3-amino-2,3,6-trideoxy-4-keto-D-glucose/dTDP-3-amino-3,4,6-trideoxy-alpha-D-glucose/dTDP-2,6-dideoxy-D-kanosamine transaminase